MNSHAMNTVQERATFAEGSLRSMVAKWLWPTQAEPARVTVFSRTAVGGTRFVRVEMAQQERSVSFLFFRHTDGTWQIFPPAVRGPMMRCH
jgi:hypothetical protein